MNREKKKNYNLENSVTSLALMDVSLTLLSGDRSKDDIHLFQTTAFGFRDESILMGVMRLFCMCNEK